VLVVVLQLLYSQSSIAGHKSKDGCTLTRDYLAVARDISVFYMWLKPSYTAGYYEHHKGAQPTALKWQFINCLNGFELHSFLVWIV